MIWTTSLPHHIRIDSILKAIRTVLSFQLALGSKQSYFGEHVVPHVAEHALERVVEHVVETVIDIVYRDSYRDSYRNNYRNSYRTSYPARYIALQQTLRRVWSSLSEKESRPREHQSPHSFQ